MSTRNFQQIYDRFGNRIRRFVSQKVSDSEYIDDLVQDIFLKIHNHIDELDDHEKLDRWVFRIAKNRVIDYYRTHGKEHVSDFAEPVASPGELTEYDLVFSNDIREWIDRLPETYRQVIKMTELENRKYAEVAGELSLSVPAVKSRVLRGRYQLKQMLLKCCHFEFDRRGGIADCEPKKYCPECVTIGMQQ